MFLWYLWCYSLYKWWVFHSWGRLVHNRDRSRYPCQTLPQQIWIVFPVDVPFSELRRLHDLAEHLPDRVSPSRRRRWRERTRGSSWRHVEEDRDQLGRRFFWPAENILIIVGTALLFFWEGDETVSSFIIQNHFWNSIPSPLTFVFILTTTVITFFLALLCPGPSQLPLSSSSSTAGSSLTTFWLVLVFWP